MKKHAYLIFAHTNFNQLKLLLQLLDDERNDIFLHIEERVQSVNPDDFSSCCMHAHFYSAKKRCHGCWGDKSQVIQILSLLKQAVQTDVYQYYHVLSGVDLPLKTQDYIHSFFQEHDGEEFVHVNYSVLYDKKTRKNVEDRIKYYHFFTRLMYYQKHSSIFGRILRVCHVHGILDLISVTVQKLLRINRLSDNQQVIYRGSSWFSITHDFVIALLSIENEINEAIRYSLCADELFVQNYIMQSEFRNSLSPSGNMRHINWVVHGSTMYPYVFRVSDLDELLNSDKLFARKFDENIDRQIITALYEHLVGESDSAKKGESVN